MPKPVSLTITGNRQRSVNSAIADFQAAEAAVSALLEQLLSGIEMQRDRLHPQVVQGIRDPVVLDLAELRRGEIGDHRHVGGFPT